MGRKIEIVLEKRNLHFVAELLEDLAPRTCDAVWRALPQGGQAYHAKFASNEFFTLVPPFADPEPELENPTVTPTAGDLLYFYFPFEPNFPSDILSLSSEIPSNDTEPSSARVGFVDLAVFYDRNNLIFSPEWGWLPGSVFGRVTENLEGLAVAGRSIWSEGFVGERLIFRRIE